MIRSSPRSFKSFNQLVRDLDSFLFSPFRVSALNGDNVTEQSSAATWYPGPTMLSCLEEIDVTRGALDLAFRMAVQLVNRPSKYFRGYCGRIASGEVKVGDRVRVAPSGMETTDSIHRCLAEVRRRPRPAIPSPFVSRTRSTFRGAV